MSLLTEGLLNQKSLDDAKQGKIVYVNINEIIPNENNIYPMNDIPELSENIQEAGLMQPLLVVRKGKRTILHTGHRRLAAIKMLRSSNEPVYFMGKELGDEVPVIYLQNMDEMTERISMLQSNSHRAMSTEERIAVVREADKYYMQLIKDGNRPVGREREWISSVTGFADGSVKFYLAHMDDVPGQNAPEKTEDEKREEVAEKCSRRLASFEKFISDINIDEISALDHITINAQIDNIIEILKEHLYQK